jgi:small neutral amino acid transporter SnatA (MarC family)
MADNEPEQKDKYADLKFALYGGIILTFGLAGRLMFGFVGMIVFAILGGLALTLCGFAIQKLKASRTRQKIDAYRNRSR